VPYFICPNCRERSIDHDRQEGLTRQAVACHRCGFGFLFELLDDHYPAPNTGFIVCDQQSRILASGRGVFELTGYREDELKAVLPAELHPTALDILKAPLVHDDEPRPRLESHGTYIVGVLLVPVVVPDEDRVFYQEVDVLLTSDVFVTVSKTPSGEHPFDPRPAKDACHPSEPIGMYLFRLLDDMAERYLAVFDDVND